MLNFGSEACADLSNDPASRQSDEEVKLQTLLCGLREVGLGGDRAAAACTRALEGLLYALLDESEGTVPETEQVVLEKLMPLVCTFVVSLGMMESSEQVDLPPLSNLEQSSDSSDGVSFVHSQAELENIWLQCADHIMARRLAKQLYGTIVTGTASDSIVKSMEVYSTYCILDAMTYYAIESHKDTENPRASSSGASEDFASTTSEFRPINRQHIRLLCSLYLDIETCGYKWCATCKSVGRYQSISSNAR